MDNEIDLTDYLTTRGMEYLDEIPDDVPEGKVLVHNLEYIGQQSGEDGFRFWVTNPDLTRQVSCHCAFAPNVSRHYRTSRPTTT